MVSRLREAGIDTNNFYSEFSLVLTLLPYKFTIGSPGGPTRTPPRHGAVKPAPPEPPLPPHTACGTVSEHAMGLGSLGGAKNKTMADVSASVKICQRIATEDAETGAGAAHRWAREPEARSASKPPPGARQILATSSSSCALPGTWAKMQVAQGYAYSGNWRGRRQLA